MPFDYLGEFPIPPNLLPPKLRSLLEPIGLISPQYVEVACLSEPENQEDAI